MESRIMPVSGGGFEQACNAQVAVHTGSLLVVAAAVTQATNDKEQAIPMLEQLATLPERLGKAGRLLADTGFCRGKHGRIAPTGLRKPWKRLKNHPKQPASRQNAPAV